MAITIDNAIERLNTPRAIFDEEITKANLIPVFEELKANDDEDDMLDLLLYTISDADYFDDMSWILTQISEDDEDYPKTHRFLENIIENVKKEYTSTELTDLCDVIADKLTNARSTSSFTSFLECSEDFDSATVTILNGTHYLECSIDDNERYCIRDIYDIFKAIDNTCKAEPIALDVMTPDAQRYYDALTLHVSNGEHLMPIELKFLKRELEQPKGN